MESAQPVLKICILKMIASGRGYFLSFIIMKITIIQIQYKILYMNSFCFKLTKLGKRTFERKVCLF